MTSSIKLRFYAASLLLVFFLAVPILNCGKDDPQAPGTTIVTVDTIPPAGITDLFVRQATTNSLIILWTAPGDDGKTGRAAQYDIRYSTSLISDQNWNSATPAPEIPAPQQANKIETFTVKGLASARSYYVAIKTYDEEQNESPLSNCPMGTTISETVPPAPIIDLAATTLSDTEILLTWTAPGDDGMEGTASRYDIRYKNENLVFDWALADTVTGENPPKPGGEPDSFIVTGMDPNTSYRFAVKSYDDMPNESQISNLALVMGHNVYLMLVPRSVYVGEMVDIHFKASVLRVRIDIKRINWGGGGYLPWKTFSGQYTEGIHIIAWDLTSDNGNPTNNGLQYYFDLFWGDAKIDSAVLRVVDTPLSK